VRVALVQLTAEGLLENLVGRGFRVPPLLRQAVEEAHPLLTQLEPMALAAAPLCSAKCAKRLEALTQRMERAAGEPQLLLSLDGDWHRCLIEGCGNGRLQRYVEELRDTLRRYELAHLQFAADARLSIDEHRAIAAAEAAQHRESATTLLQQHWQRGRNELLARITKNDSCLVKNLTRCLAMPILAQDAGPERPWTLMIYGAADNNAHGPIIDFLDSIRTALDDDPGMELIVFIDRSEGFSDDAEFFGSNFSGAGLFRLRKDKAERLDPGEYFPGMKLGEDNEVDSSDPLNIESFVAYSKHHFPAKNYGLMIYSHANGYTMCPDEESGGEMYIPQLTEQVSSAASVDFLALELCNMAGVEIAYQWRPGNGGFSADTLVAIPNAGPPLDWDRAFRRIRTEGHKSSAQGPHFDPASLSPAQFGKLVVEEGQRGRIAMAQRFPEEAERIQLESAACFDLTIAAQLKQEIDAMARALAQGDARESMDALRGEATDPLVMNYSGRGYPIYPYADLFDLARRIAERKELSESARQAATQVCKTMDNFVVQSFGMPGLKGFQPGKNGIFIVFPDQRAWQQLPGYTPLEAFEETGPYGRWAFLRDGATPDNGIVENWFELMDACYDDTSGDPGGSNGYLW